MPVKVLLVHNFYQRPGGEDQVFGAEGTMLERNGHEVLRYTVANDALNQTPASAMAVQTVWNRRTHAELTRIVSDERPDVVHFHNTFPVISPAAYHAARGAGAAVVQTLHNYRLICSNAQLFRDGRPCEDCVAKRVRWPGVVHRCYRSSVLASGTIVAMLSVHEALQTWRRSVDRYIALTEFARAKFVAGGLPARKVAVKPNFVADDPGVGTGDGGFALFVGRLSPEKGIEAMLDAWTSGAPGLPLKVVGSGPLDEPVAARASQVARIEWLGQRTNEEVREFMKRAAVLVVPSIWYEGLPMTIVEAFAVGLPVVASDLGSMASLVETGRTGVLFPAGDPSALAQAVRHLAEDETARSRMGIAARAEYEEKYTASRNHELLLSIYRAAIADATRS